MKSICILTQSDYEIDPRVRRKAELLASCGYRVDVLALRSPDGVKSRTLNGVNIYTMSLPKKRGSLARYLYQYSAFFLWACVRVTILMRRHRYAVIDVNTLPDFLIFAPFAARLMGAKLILDMHEITPEFYMSKYGLDERSWPVRLMKFVERLSFRFADHVITINEPIEDLLVQRGLVRDKSTIIMNAADEARFATATHAGAGATKNGSRFVMLYHGTLTRIYGLDIAIEAFSLVQQDMPGAEFWILGSGTEAEPLATLVKQRGLGERVKLLGQVESSEIPSWLMKCDVGILPIRRDVFLDFAFPNKLPEFIIMGKAVIISRLNAINHYFSSEALAYSDPNSAEDLAVQMVRLYRDPELRARLAMRAKKEYGPTRWDVMKQRYLALIGRMVDPVLGGATRPSRSDPGVLVG